MKITKQELIEMEACEEGLHRFIAQTGDTDEPVEVSSLIGGENTYSDLLWLAGKTSPKERIVRFACDCALLNIELIKPYIHVYYEIVEFLRNPTADYAGDYADDAARAASFAIGRAVYAAHAAGAAARAVHAAHATCAAHSAYYVARAASFAAGVRNSEKVNELLKNLFV